MPWRTARRRGERLRLLLPGCVRGSRRGSHRPCAGRQHNGVYRSLFLRVTLHRQFEKGRIMPIRILIIDRYSMVSENVKIGASIFGKQCSFYERKEVKK